MKGVPFKSSCPLCGKPFLQVELHVHMVLDRSSIRQDTIQHIMGQHPGWTPEEGACKDCWESHRDFVRRGAPH